MGKADMYGRRFGVKNKASGLTYNVAPMNSHTTRYSLSNGLFIDKDRGDWYQIYAPGCGGYVDCSMHGGGGYRIAAPCGRFKTLQEALNRAAAIVLPYQRHDLEFALGQTVNGLEIIHLAPMAA